MCFLQFIYICHFLFHINASVLKQKKHALIEIWPKQSVVSVINSQKRSYPGIHFFYLLANFT